MKKVFLVLYLLYQNTCQQGNYIGDLKLFHPAGVDFLWEGCPFLYYTLAIFWGV